MIGNQFVKMFLQGRAPFSASPHQTKNRQKRLASVLKKDDKLQVAVFQ